MGQIVEWCGSQSLHLQIAAFIVVPPSSVGHGKGMPERRRSRVMLCAISHYQDDSGSIKLTSGYLQG